MKQKRTGKKGPDTAAETPYHKDDMVEVTIDDIGSDGEGIGKVEGYTLFVKDAVIGDKISCKIMKAKKNYAFARLMEIREPSPFRVEPRCEIASKCGGCQIQAMAYGRQLAFKQNKVRNDLIRIGHFAPEEVDRVMHPIVGMEDPYHYRNKAQVPVGEKDGEPIAGFYAGRTHAIVPVTECRIGAKENQKILSAVLDYMKRYHVTAYNEQTGEGLLRHILIRGGVYSEEIMVCLIVNGKSLPHEKELVELLSVLPGMTSITLNTNTERSNVILGKKIRTLWGRDSIQDTLHVFRVVDHPYTAAEEASAAAPDGMRQEKDADMEKANGSEYRESTTFEPENIGVSFNISPLSFYQVNPKQTEKLYSIALHYADLHQEETVWDLYCGVGTISLFLAGFAKEVYGVEIVPEAIRDARINAQQNGITNAVFEVGKVEEVLPAYVEKRKREEGALDGKGLVDVVCVDPPRKGCDEKCLSTIIECAPKRVVYVSCDPATLARDLRILVDGGYELKDVTPVDQFGHTVHVETVCLMSRVEGK